MSLSIHSSYFLFLKSRKTCRTWGNIPLKPPGGPLTSEIQLVRSCCRITLSSCSGRSSTSQYFHFFCAGARKNLNFRIEILWKTRFSSIFLNFLKNLNFSQILVSPKYYNVKISDLFVYLVRILIVFITDSTWFLLWITGNDHIT